LSRNLKILNDLIRRKLATTINIGHLADGGKLKDNFVLFSKDSGSGYWVYARTLGAPYDDIVYIESLSDYIKVITVKDEIMSKEKISNLVNRLPEIFLRIHRSFVINTDKIKNISSDEVTVDDIALTIGRSYRKVVKESLKNI